MGTKLRGLLGLGLVGGVLGFAGGTLWSIGTSLVRLGVFIDRGFWWAVASDALGTATLWGLLGAFTATAFGSCLALTDSKRSLDQLPLWRMAALGAVAGAAFLPAFVGIRFGVTTLIDAAHTLPYSMALLGTFGAAFTTSLVAIAQRAHRAELAIVDETRELLEREVTGSR